MMKTYDVTIIGAGMTGATLAIALHQKSQGQLSIAVVEAHPPNAHSSLSEKKPSSIAENNQHPGFDARTLALSHGTSKALKSLGLWSEFEPFVTPLTDIEVSDKGHLGLVDISAEQAYVPALGYVVELNSVAALYQKQLQRIGCDYYCPKTVTQVMRDQDKVTLELSTIDQGGLEKESSADLIQSDLIQTKLVVAADGANSQTCRLVGLNTESTNYQQHAIIANVSTQLDHQGKAFERFTQHGPLAFLPMSIEEKDTKQAQALNAVVWCVDSAKVEQLMALDDQTFCQTLQTQFGWRLGKLIHAGKRHSYPLIQQQAQSIISHRFVAVGNAAQALHPIAGQGFNLGIRDVMQLAQTLVQAHQNQQDVGAYSVLAHYKKQRQEDRQSTLSLTGGLVRIFSNDWLSLRIGRNLGLLAVDMLPPLKQPLIQHTMNGNKKMILNTTQMTNTREC